MEGLGAAFGRLTIGLLELFGAASFARAELVGTGLVLVVAVTSSTGATVASSGAGVAFE